MKAFRSIKTKVVFGVALISLATILIVVIIAVGNYRANLLRAKKDTLTLATDQLDKVIRGIMVSGEAPIAVNTIKLIKTINEYKEIEIYRKDGTRAFNDYTTLEFVNNFQNIIEFRKTERIENSMTSNELFAKVVNSNLPVSTENKQEAQMEYYFPIRNTQECWVCHNTAQAAGPIRGVAYFKISIRDVYTQIRNATLVLSILLFGFGSMLMVFVIVYIQRIVVKPVFAIGSAVKDFGEGRLDSAIRLRTDDELGELSVKINTMFQGIRERLELAKYVSKSTDAMIRSGASADKGQTKEIAVLFSDIRGFTSYTEKNPADVVIRNLNRMLQEQSDIVHEFGGDIDKYVGDELMALFDDPLVAVKCAYAIVMRIRNLNREGDLELKVGIGIDYGAVIAGNIGSDQRKEFAVIGDTVNFASRLCGIAKPDMILVSEHAYGKIRDHLDAVPIKGQKIKGKSGEQSFYAVRKIV